MESTAYGVTALADLAGVSVRTLHYYDEIGLLRPAERTSGGYRRYTREELLRLQQILFFRELDIPLSDIRRYLDDPAFDPLETLERHRTALRARAARTERLLRTIEKTITSLRGGDAMLSNKELYDGLKPEEIEQYEAEAENRWPQEFAEVNTRVRSMSKDEWNRIKEQGEEATEALAALLRSQPDADPASPAAQEIVARHRKWIGNFYEVDAERYRGLAEMYVADERFAGFYEKYEPGLARFLSEAMKVHAQTL